MMNMPTQREMTKMVKRTTNVTIVLVALFLGSLFIIATARNAMAASLKNTSIVTKNVLTAGDLFDGLSPDKAAHILGAAPQPNNQMTLNARTLLRVALALDLSWRPTSNADQITVHRAATVIETQEIKDKLTKALQDKGIDGRFTLDLGLQTPRIILPPEHEAEFVFTDLTYDNNSNHFHAVIKSPSESNTLAQITLSGKVEHVVSIPVINTNIRNGSLISTKDINWIDVNRKDLQHDTILDAEELLNMTPRRMIVAGKSISSRDIEKPQIVNRGEGIVLIYSQGPITLTTEGKAMENGAKGDIIRVVNTDSSLTVSGTIVAPRTVQVGS